MIKLNDFIARGLRRFGTSPGSVAKVPASIMCVLNGDNCCTKTTVDIFDEDLVTGDKSVAKFYASEAVCD